MFPIGRLRMLTNKYTCAPTQTDNFCVTLKFEDGSLCNLIYSSLGTNIFPKESAQIFVDGKILILEDYKKLKILENGKTYTSSFKGKGHLEELKRFSDAITVGHEWPISWAEQYHSSQIAFEVEKQINS